MSPVESQRWVRDVMEKTYPLGVFCDRTNEAPPKPKASPAPALDKIPAILGIADEANSNPASTRQIRTHEVDLQVRVAGFGGQGVLLLGEILAEAGLDAGFEVSWLPSYGPEMRSGTSNCHVRISSQPIDSPLVTLPHVLVAMNEPSLRKFDASVRPGGWVIYNGDSFPADCLRPDVQVMALPFSRLADELGDPRISNMIMLGTLLEITGVLSQASIDAALRSLVKHAKWVDLDERAIARGKELFRESLSAV
jgi:Pyruvate/2-oxoacid:ferredoxin oxidoreductase gamma subunit